MASSGHQKHYPLAVFVVFFLLVFFFFVVLFEGQRTKGQFPQTYERVQTCSQSRVPGGATKQILPFDT